MNKSGIGVGSASVVLVFAVLCLTIFSLISYTAAVNDKALADVEARLVQDYYEADTLAERVLAEITAADSIAGSVFGVEVETTRWDPELSAETAEFSCPMPDGKELRVKIAIYGDSYDVLTWRMQSTGGWVIEDDLPVWSGE